MATATSQESKTSTLASRAARKLWREVSRPIRRISRPTNVASAAAETIECVPPPPGQNILTGSGAGMAGFHPQQATVEPEAITFIQRLVNKTHHQTKPNNEICT